MSEKLKPCPFCGGKAEMFELDQDEPANAGGSVIQCSVCQASSAVEFGTKETLVERWNRRTPTPEEPTDDSNDQL